MTLGVEMLLSKNRFLNLFSRVGYLGIACRSLGRSWSKLRFARVLTAVLRAQRNELMGDLQSLAPTSLRHDIPS